MDREEVSELQLVDHAKSLQNSFIRSLVWPASNKSSLMWMSRLRLLHVYIRGLTVYFSFPFCHLQVVLLNVYQGKTACYNMQQYSVIENNDCCVFLSK